MTLDRFRPLADRAVDPGVVLARRLGLSPDAVSIVAVAVAGGAGLAFAFAGADPRLYLAGAALVVCNGWLDIVDGALARKLQATSAAGDLLDHVLDRYADLAVVAGLAAGVGRYGLGLAAVSGVLLTSYLGTQAQAVGLDRVYGGLLGRADRLVLVTVVGAVTALFSGPVVGGLGPRLGLDVASVPASVLSLTLVGWLLVVLAVVGHLTALQRLTHAYRALD